MKKIFLLVLAVLCMVSIVGCQPPISVSFRKSAMDFGKTKVMRITNRRENKTIVAQIRVTRYIDVNRDDIDQEARHIVRIGPGDTVELGRLEMDWAFETDDFIRIDVNGYEQMTLYVP